MIHVYYHIYAIDGVESIVDEQLELINTFFDFNYILNIGISIANENQSICNIIEKFNKPNFKIREVRAFGNEFTTIDLIEKDKQKFGNSDYILYLHTKGASKQHNENVIHWRHLMNYFNIEKVKNVFKLFEKTNYNTYGVLLCKINGCTFYSGNFWWMKSNYAKSIVVEDLYKNRFNAEIGYIQSGIDWKPYSSYNRDEINYYQIDFKREEYAK
jgi:hypothetical protein